MWLLYVACLASTVYISPVYGSEYLNAFGQLGTVYTFVIASQLHYITSAITSRREFIVASVTLWSYIVISLTTASAK